MTTSPTQPEGPRATRRFDAGTWLLMPALLAIAALLRVREAMRTSPWFDEIYTLWTSRDAARVLEMAHADVHPPLHFFIVSAWAALGGEGTLWLRASSILPGLAAIVVTFWIGRDLFGRRAGLLAAAFLAIHPTHVYFSQELRAYALLWFLLPLAWWFAWHWIEATRRTDAPGEEDLAARTLPAHVSGTGLILTSTLALYTHYFAGLVLAALGLWGVLALFRRPARLAGWIALHLGTAVLFAPQLPVFIEQLSRQSASHWIEPPVFDHLIRLARHVAFNAIYLLPIVGGLALLPLTRARERRAASMLWFVIVLPILAAWLVTVRGGHLFTERYMFFALPAMFVLVAAAAVSLPDRPARWLAAGFLLAMGARAMWLADPQAESTLLAKVATEIEADASEDDALIFADTHSYLYFRHNHPDLGRQHLLWLEPPIPYYEGASVIPPDDVLSGEGFEPYRSAGARWWGVHVRHGGVDTRRAADLMAGASGMPPRTHEFVRVWGPFSVP